jgi:hypothetical protein
MSTSKPSAKFIRLTDEQLSELREFYEHAGNEAKDGRPGMLIAQIGHTHSSIMRVGWLSHEVAKKLNALLAVESALTSKSSPPDPDQPAHTSADEPII